MIRIDAACTTRKQHRGAEIRDNNWGSERRVQNDEAEDQGPGMGSEGWTCD